jgi:Ras-related GTP-binding protein C/D
MIDSTAAIHDSRDDNSSELSSKNFNVVVRPRILLTGLRRSGKTSIQRVIFTKMQPSQTQFLESTPHLTLNQFSCGSFINFQVQELPGQLQMFSSTHHSGSSGHGIQASSYDDDSMSSLPNGGYDMQRLLKRCNAVVYIIDAQDDYSESITRLNAIIELGRGVNPRIRYEVFIHKVDQLSEETKIETQRDIHNQVDICIVMNMFVRLKIYLFLSNKVRDHFADSMSGIDSWSSTSTVSNSNPQDILINFHLTSIFDHSIFEAFSKVIQKLLPQFGHLERLLNYLLATSNIEQAFLFDVQTKISIATDSSPTDMQVS